MYSRFHDRTALITAPSAVVASAISQRDLETEKATVVMTLQSWFIDTGSFVIEYQRPVRALMLQSRYAMCVRIYVHSQGVSLGQHSSSIKLIASSARQF
jgi:hypothetical protein